MGILNRFFRPPSKDTFAHLLMDGIRNAGESGPIIYDAAEFCLRKENRQVTSLANAYIEYCAATSQKQNDVLKRWIRGWFLLDKETPREFEDVRPDLYPALRNRAYFETLSLRAKLEHGKVQHWPYKPVGEHLAAALVHDMRDGLRTIRDDELEAWRISFYEALEVAIDNLKRLPARLLGPKEGDGLYLISGDDNHGASRLLLLDMIRGLSVKGDPIALVPTRDVTLVAGSDDCDALRAMVAFAKGEKDNHHPVTTITQRLQGDEWFTWLPPQNHALYNEFKLLQLERLVGDYRVQKELLDALHQKQGTDLFVAGCNAVQNNKTGQATSYAVWAADLVTWLPQVDMIAFMKGPDSKPQMYPWDQVVQAAGDMLKPLDIYPLRYEVRGFPNEQQFAAMGTPGNL
jgi:hypothetical protein